MMRLLKNLLSFTLTMWDVKTYKYFDNRGNEVGFTLTMWDVKP